MQTDGFEPALGTQQKRNGFVRRKEKKKKEKLK